ncbi:MAG: hypothetical protein AAGC68_06040 [Verrucomicrobiota bacterium]
MNRLEPPPLPKEGSCLAAVVEESGAKPLPGFFDRLSNRIGRFFDHLIGFFALLGTLAVASTVPVFNLLCLGYLLTGASAVIHSSRLRCGLPGLPLFTVLGKIALGIWLWYLPIRLLHSFLIDSRFLGESGEEASALRGVLAFLIVVISLHLAWALARGGRLRHFLWPQPIRFFRWLSGSREHGPIPLRPVLNRCRETAAAVWNCFLTGAQGFLVGATWLILPVSLLFLASSMESPGPSFFVSLFGGVLLGVVILYLPFLQTAAAASTKIADGFRVRNVKLAFRRAPLAFWSALFVTVLFAIPLYLLKIELTPDELAWLPNLAFVALMLPAHLLVGWAMARSRRSETDRHPVSRWSARLLALPVVSSYVFAVWMNQYLSWHGSWGLLEQHAFLLPAPLFGI